jgi:hypothetical protein
MNYTFKPNGEPKYAITASEIQPSVILKNGTNTEWARLDPEGKLIHLDMDLCRKGPSNVYTQLAIGIWDAAVKERDAVLRQALSVFEERGHYSEAEAVEAIKEVLNEPVKP